MRVQEFADEYGESVIQRMVDYRVRLDTQSEGSKSLCPDAPKWLRAIDKFANRLDRQQYRALAAYYSVQYVDGQRPHNRLIAREIGMSPTKFREHLQRGRKKLLGLLNS